MGPMADEDHTLPISGTPTLLDAPRLSLEPVAPDALGPRPRYTIGRARK